MRRTVAFSKNSSNIFFHILTQCNLNCIYCYINPEEHGKKVLSVETIKTWLNALPCNKSETNVIFLGGEPSLHPDLPAAIKHVKKSGYGSVTIDTNGYLFNNLLSKISPDELDYLSFSLDGATGTTNDKIRGKGSYDKCIAGIRDAVLKRFNTSLIYTVSRANLKELNNMPGLLQKLGVDRFFIQVIGIRGKSVEKRENDLQISRAQWFDTVPRVAEKAAQLGIITTYPKVFLGHEELFECAGIVADNYFIFPNGRVYKCPLCEDFPLHSMAFKQNRPIKTSKINETDLFHLTINEGCVMNKLIQPQNLRYGPNGTPEYKVACCMLKQEISYSNL